MSIRRNVLRMIIKRRETILVSKKRTIRMFLGTRTMVSVSFSNYMCNVRVSRAATLNLYDSP